jgi:hypothetical protein
LKITQIPKDKKNLRKKVFAVWDFKPKCATQLAEVITLKVHISPFKGSKEFLLLKTEDVAREKK